MSFHRAPDAATEAVHADLEQVAGGALTRVHVATERAGLFASPSSYATGEQLDTIEDALNHPPKRVGIMTTLVSIASSISLCVKVLHDAGTNGEFAMTTISLALFAVGALGAALRGRNKSGLT